MSALKTFTLCAGVWEYWFKDIDTNQPLSCKISLGTLMENENVVKIEVPDDICENPNAMIHIQRTR